MTVEELIEVLKGLPQNACVAAYEGERCGLRIDEKLSDGGLYQVTFIDIEEPRFARQTIINWREEPRYSK